MEPRSVLPAQLTQFITENCRPSRLRESVRQELNQEAKRTQDIYDLLDRQIQYYSTLRRLIAFAEKQERAQSAKSCGPALERSSLEPIGLELQDQIRVLQAKKQSLIQRNTRDSSTIAAIARMRSIPQSSCFHYRDIKFSNLDRWRSPARQLKLDEIAKAMQDHQRRDQRVAGIAAAALMPRLTGFDLDAARTMAWQEKDVWKGDLATLFFVELIANIPVLSLPSSLLGDYLDHRFKEKERANFEGNGEHRDWEPNTATVIGGVLGGTQALGLLLRSVKALDGSRNTAVRNFVKNVQKAALDVKFGTKESSAETVLDELNSGAGHFTFGRPALAKFALEWNRLDPELRQRLEQLLAVALVRTPDAAPRYLELKLPAQKSELNNVSEWLKKEWREIISDNEKTAGVKSKQLIALLTKHGSNLQESSPQDLRLYLEKIEALIPTIPTKPAQFVSYISLAELCKSHSPNDMERFVNSAVESLAIKGNMFSSSSIRSIFELLENKSGLTISDITFASICRKFSGSLGSSDSLWFARSYVNWLISKPSITTRMKQTEEGKAFLASVANKIIVNAGSNRIQGRELGYAKQILSMLE